MEDAYSIPWQGNKSLHKQQSKDRQQSRGQEYEEVDGGRGGSDPTYMEVGQGGNTFQLKGNEAYAIADNN